jgi:hypothetical protein
MIGHQGIVAMRRRRRVPNVVVMLFDPALAAKDWPAVDPRIAYVAIEQRDNPARIDLRCMVGLPVVVLGLATDPVKATVDALIAAGAKTIGASIFEPGPAETYRALEHFDTKDGQWQTC